MKTVLMTFFVQVGDSFVVSVLLNLNGYEKLNLISQ